MDKKVFVAYNTDSIVNTFVLPKKRSIKKLWNEIQKKCDLTALRQQNPINTSCLREVTSEVEKVRFSIFKTLHTFYKGHWDLYFDILDKNWQTPKLQTHSDKNRLRIQNSDFIIFVIADDETSFWQLQEAYFASYYDKPIFYVKTKRFLSLICHQKLDSAINKAIGHALNSK